MYINYIDTNKIILTYRRKYIMEKTRKNIFEETITEYEKVYIFHHFDADGYASAAAVALNYYEKITGDDKETIESIIPIEYFSCNS